ncbi:RNA polymerase epsilon subunit [Bacillus carboniphilus]|uniref:DNA-directed RNA polymerase subunit epsilon n=1 Tax=Bacillus carboniphilus TaxID=86663 RepID=A0ABY9JXP7_9BACI|nr:DNA-dependent RNA polymerase auxiliary subunit epsilon family protein [Bacillus carboniphilus]WLR43288.1 RNA polymerase epsilon subunit [Bacillus carboniphilus]
MIFKVYYQYPAKEVPVRERTNTIYVEAESDREVRIKLKDKNYNIEHIERVTGNYLDYEKNNENFKVLEI